MKIVYKMMIKGLAGARKLFPPLCNDSVGNHCDIIRQLKSR